jgi:hypothetical protein
MVDAGQPCEFDTRGPLQRAHIIANWPPIYIGKESDRHSEEGEDLSLLDFKAIEYKRRGNAVADDEQLARIAKVPKREFMRRGINQHTLEKICKQEPVRTSKLTECLKALANGQTIRTIAWAADVRQDRTLPENGTAANRGRQKLRFQTLHIAELGTFRRLTLPEIPSSLLLMCPTYSLLDIRRSDSVLCRLAIVEF